ncbi:unnamed protein product [Dracunculus medinensis]|uniref:Calx-beta domain-containing protein n=1 Tax=Dracunculus medinensis TaxID=318479 RepID=A0A0N4U8L2_DRAME|nr:unnamed protein product [Dracunculus medinensis]
MKAKTLDEAIIERSIEFSARVYSIQEADQYVKLRILRHGPTDTSVTFRYTTKNGAAKKDLHFLQKSETERFSPGESIKEIYIGLIAEASWRAEHVFYVQLRIESNENSENKTVLGKISVASVRKPDLSSSFIGEPMVQFVQRNYVRYVRAFVTRIGRHDKKNFLVHYYTEGITAISDIDFQAVTDGTLNFADSEYEKFIDIRIFDDMQEEKDETFVIQLSNPSQDITIGPNNKAVVTIMCDDNILKNIKDISKLTTYYLDNMIHGANNWYEQIVEATSVNSGDTVNATFLDCILHVIAFPWKIIVALIPPPMICGGWLCFFIALSDFANIFGCMVGLKDTATAITLVALGTSLPDTIASKIAAENDRTADNAIGNITGSNSVNVFLGLGLPWLIASIYWSTKNENFVVNAGDLGFSVALFTITSVLYHLMLTLRRNIAFFGNAELGGPICPKLFSAFFIFSLWLAYIFLSILKTYGRVIDV